jgi:hypothetical protein
MSADERRRFVSNMEVLFAEYQLRPEEIAAVKSLEPLTVAKVGAHPILAWTAVHLLAADMRAQGRQSPES